MSKQSCRLDRTAAQNASCATIRFAHILCTTLAGNFAQVLRVRQVVNYKPIIINVFNIPKLEIEKNVIHN